FHPQLSLAARGPCARPARDHILEALPGRPRPRGERTARMQPVRPRAGDGYLRTCRHRPRPASISPFLRAAPLPEAAWLTNFPPAAPIPEWGSLATSRSGNPNLPGEGGFSREL